MVSIIIPVYNVEDKIEKCIISILKQTYKDFELILIDDGSTDDSLKICQKYVKLDNRVKVYEQINSGVSEARNNGIKMAHGEYIQFVDSDDQILSDMLENMVAKIKNEEIDLVICGYNEILGCKGKKTTPSINEVVGVEDLHSKYADIFRCYLLNPVWNKIYKKNKIHSLFLKDMSMGEDLIFNLEYMKNIDKIAFVDKAFYQYYVYENSLTRKIRKDSIEIAEKLYLESKKFCEKYKLIDSGYRDISNIFIKFLFYGISDIYRNREITRNEKKLFLKRWMSNSNVKTAIEIVKFVSLKEKFATFLLKRRFTEVLHLLYLIKGYYDDRRYMREKKENIN